MGDKSAYLGPGSYGAAANPGGYQAASQSGTGMSGNYSYAREEYAFNMNDGGQNQGQGQSSGSAGGAPQVTKPRTDVSCYLGPK
ncbi:hypothetical protein M3Y94_00074900 [Aphelenchoides besseyi]|nr:hypothetical protein M3Y94_00074900 [Aphelenchoides besseyi]KAI6237841.1 hypothetical protein M3Y95_00307200 [Aphelenchoides besseyi]